MSQARIYRPTRRPWFVAGTRGGRLFQLWMVAFFLGTAAIVTGVVPLEGQLFGLPAPMGALYLLEGLTIAVLVLAYRRHWAPRSRAADARVRQNEGDGTP